MRVYLYDEKASTAQDQLPGSAKDGVFLRLWGRRGGNLPVPIGSQFGC